MVEIGTKCCCGKLAVGEYEANPFCRDCLDYLTKRWGKDNTKPYPILHKSRQVVEPAPVEEAEPRIKLIPNIWGDTRTEVIKECEAEANKQLAEIQFW